MKKEQVLNAIVGKLISEGVLAENYNTNEALMVLSHCVMPIKLQTYLVNCEEEVKVRLEKLSQIKQINATENPESLPRIKQQFTADEAEDYINQEVEKRIAETVAMYGWICPRCGAVHSPFELRCDCPPPVRTWISSGTGEWSVLDGKSEGGEG